MDLLIRLYEIDTVPHSVVNRKAPGITTRKPIGTERNILINWVHRHFHSAWAGETETALSHFPPRCFVAVHQRRFVGFACYDAAALGFFGPLGVLESHRGKGIGKALLHSCLMDMRSMGYGYAVVGMAASEAFYRHCAGATRISRSSKSIWKTWVREEQDSPRRNGR